MTSLLPTSGSQLAQRAPTPLEFDACADTGPPAITVHLSRLVNTAQCRISTVSGVAGG